MIPRRSPCRFFSICCGMFRGWIRVGFGGMFGLDDLVKWGFRPGSQWWEYDLVHRISRKSCNASSTQYIIQARRPCQKDLGGGDGFNFEARLLTHLAPMEGYYGRNIDTAVSTQVLSFVAFVAASWRSGLAIISFHGHCPAGCTTGSPGKWRYNMIQWDTPRNLAWQPNFRFGSCDCHQFSLSPEMVLRF